MTVAAAEADVSKRASWPAEGSFDRTNYLAFDYTRAVPCGLRQACTDHALIPVAVQAGETVPNIDAVDLVPGATAFPLRPGP